MKIKNYILLVLYLVKIVHSQKLFVFDTTTDRNPDFDMDAIPDGAIYQGFDVTEDYNNENGPHGLIYNFGNQPLISQFGGSHIIVNSDTTFDKWTCTNCPNVSYNILQDYFVGKYPPDQFFPFDGRGFGNDGDNHNYKWCVWFRYEKVQARLFEPGIVSIVHSDDLIVYVDEKKVIETIGITDVQFAEFLIDQPDPWNTHTLDIINCNRKRRDNFHMFDLKTTVVLDCVYYDQCGICEGNDECACKMGYNCFEDENSCIANYCYDEFNCEPRDFNCSETYPDVCKNQFCTPGLGCESFPVDCNDNNPCTSDSCSSSVGCINQDIPNCARCSDTNSCVTIDPCIPVECHADNPDVCVMTPINCSTSDPCLLGRCENGVCLTVAICTDPPDSGETTEYISTTLASTIYSTIISTITSTLQTTIYTSNPSTIATTSTATTTDSALPTITGSSISSTVISSIISSTLSASSTTSSSLTSGPIISTKCDHYSCLEGYKCIQLKHSFTCVSKYFNDNCDVNRLPLY
ncbi:hypothetical protein DICPUDRAFT_97568 [Dictyostelium purpureum]|uniref:PA14 domain-containing protein n=1 Tax=Dictyostelium purpureum TaxID=5786 RepID=F0ZHU8_DICPU|nr:uncharacterized protein DICPUDRAFT_97568 [Dictyostelium purpureum]EGC36484.1 hypothetical protein DICPUDRAFT_97568 [Dictyostelium purpureum]|eukprot:XP_003286997.1 hypothetical protein DICPUDRAFT_97568 [Dictyostelium purpureum]